MRYWVNKRAKELDALGICKCGQRPKAVGYVLCAPCTLARRVHRPARAQHGDAPIQLCECGRGPAIVGVGGSRVVRRVRRHADAGGVSLMGKVLIACEYSGIVRDAFIAAGHDAISCDLLPTERPGPHIQGDVRELLQWPWDLVIAHPPCTYLSRSGASWLNVQPNRIDKLIDAACFFNECYTANASMVAVENPEACKKARAIIGEPDCHVHPYHFGDLYLKLTYFWTRGLPPLMPERVAGEDGSLPMWVDGGRRGPRRPKRMHRSAKERAKFHPGMAAAMAKQWGCFLPA